MASKKRLAKIVHHLSNDSNGSCIVSNDTSESVDIEEILRDRKKLEGKIIGVSNWFTLTQEDLDTFSNLTHDHNWIHKKGAGKKGSPFGTPIGIIISVKSFLSLVFHLFTVCI